MFETKITTTDVETKNKNKTTFLKRCKNCGRTNHLLSTCRDPITSCGIICIKIKNKIMFHKINNFLLEYKNSFNIYSFNNIYHKNISNFNKYINDIEILFIQRKHSYSYIEFIKGKYNITDIKYIQELFFEMTVNERNFILHTKNFNLLWHNLWGEKTNTETDSYKNAETKYYLFIQNFNINDFHLKYPELEWGLPKGRRIINESNINCATREFNEETSYSYHQYSIVKNIIPLKEIYKANNNIVYKHIYYISLLKDFDYIPEVKSNNYEINSVQWLSFKQCLDKIRPYHIEKKKIIIELYKFLINIIEKNI